MENIAIKLDLDLAKVQVVLSGLGELKLGAALEVFVDIRGQVQRQIEAAQKSKEPEAPKGEDASA